MSNQIKIFDNPTFGAVRIVTTENNEPLFCLTDVCQALDLRQGDVRQRLDDGLVSTQPIYDSLGRQQNANFVNEDGLYEANTFLTPNIPHKDILQQGLILSSVKTARKEQAQHLLLLN